MITAIILARANSSRLKKKHLLKIGKYTLLEHIYLKLRLNRNITEIYLATGSKKRNSIYNKFIKSKKLKIKIFNYNKENKVTERIYKLSKKIKNKYSVVISGDCPAVDNNFINRAYKKILQKKSDFLKTNKKTLHEGIILFKNKAWKKVQKNSKNNIFQENPGYILSVKNNLFDFAVLKAQKKDIGKKFRLSIDTLSDLQFFRLVNYHSNNEIITYEDVIKFKKYNIINKDVIQKNPKEKNKRKIFIITSANKEIGYGHLARSKVLYRQICETYTTDITYIFYKTEINSDLKYFINNEKYLNYSVLKKKSIKDCLYIIDLPANYFNQEIKNFSKNKSIIIDNYSKFNKHVNLIPSVKEIKKTNIFSGKKYLILNKNLLFEKLKTKLIKKIQFLFLFGSTKVPENKILKDIIKSKIKNYLIILGPYVKKSIIKKLKKQKFKVKVNPKNYYEILCSSKKIISIYGISTFEAISIGIKPSIYKAANENLERLNDIKLLNKKKLSKNYEFKDLKNLNTHRKINAKISFGGGSILKFI